MYDFETGIENINTNSMYLQFLSSLSMHVNVFFFIQVYVTVMSNGDEDMFNKMLEVRITFFINRFKPIFPSSHLSN